MIKYRKRKQWKYTLEEDIVFNTEILTMERYDIGVLKINYYGRLVISKGYVWDGASFIAKDTKTFMRASCVHDALYQLIREGVLKQSDRKRADEIMRDIMIEAGASKFRAWYAYKFVRAMGKGSAQSRILTAP